MALYRHRFNGQTAGGRNFSFSWWSDSSSSLSVVHTAAVTWIGDLYAGSTGTNGYATLSAAETEVTEVTSGEIDPATGQQLTLLSSSVSQGGTSIDQNLPPEIAIVASLKTLTANGTGAGRFYLPQPTTTGSGPAGNMATATPVTVRDALEFAWTGSNSVLTPVVYSRVLRLFRPITRFRVGDRWDSIRHRDNTAAEVYSEAPMP